jgi:hypothetical protein
MGIDDNATQVGKAESVISEPNYKMGGHARKPDIDTALINPSNSGGDGVLDIPDDYNSYNNNNSNNNNNNNNSKKNNSGSSNSNSSSSSKKEKQSEGNLSELSPKEKREQVEKTAEVILLAYKQYLPIPFVYFGTHDIKKLKKLEEKDEIDLGAVVNKKGETLLEYIKEFNNSVEETFKISDAEIEMIRPALVDVLMEKEVAFTPTQRLIFTVGQLLIAKIMMLVKFIRAKSADLKEFRQMHEENKEQRNTIIRQQEEIRKQNEEILKMRNEQAKAQAQTQAEILAYLGPAIGPHAFEVGSEVRDIFMAQNLASAACFEQLQEKGKYLADIYGLACLRLNALGIEHIEGGGECTLQNPDYFSYRRDQETGRMGSFIWIETP